MGANREFEFKYLFLEYELFAPVLNSYELSVIRIEGFTQ